MKFKITYISIFCLLVHASFGLNLNNNKILEEEMRSLAKELRCLVCQNQTILESDSLMAEDVRNLITKQLKQGKTKKEIKLYLFERYGDFILFKPKFNLSNLVLWISPLLFLFLMVTLSFRNLNFRNIGNSFYREKKMLKNKDIKKKINK